MIATQYIGGTILYLDFGSGYMSHVVMTDFFKSGNKLMKTSSNIECTNFNKNNGIIQVAVLTEVISKHGCTLQFLNYVLK